MHTPPSNALLFRGAERKTVCLRAARKRGVPVGAGPHCTEDARGSADVIGVWVREDESLERAATSEDVRQDGAASGVATAPCRSRVEQHPAAIVSAQEDGIALPNIEDVQLDAAPPT